MTIRACKFRVRLLSFGIPRNKMRNRQNEGVTMGWSTITNWFVGFITTAIILAVIAIVLIIAKSLFLIALAIIAVIGCVILAPFVGGWMFILFRKCID